MTKPLPRAAAALAFVLPAWTAAAADDLADAVVVSATRFPERLIDAPVGMTVLRAAEIARSPARTLSELLAQQPGITTRNNSGSPNGQVDLRGFGITAPQNTLLLIDGVRQNEVDLSNPNWTAIPLDAIERIEIMRGSGAVLYGGGATAGTINIVTKRPARGARSIALGGGAGTYGTYEVHADGTLDADGLGMSAFANRYASDNYRQNNAVTQDNAQAALRFRGSGGEFGLSAAVDSQDLRLPGARTEAELATDPRGTATPNDYSKQDGQRVALAGRIDLGPGDLGIELGNRDTKRIAFFDDYLFGGAFANFSDTRTDVTSFSPRYRLPYDAFGARHSLIVGFDYEDWDYDSRRGTSEAAATANPAVLLRASQRNEAVYARHASTIAERLTVSVGGRLQRTNVTARDDANPAPYASATQKRSPRGYEIGARYEIGAWTPYARVGQSFRVATVDEMFDPFGGPLFDSTVTPLEPQTSRDLEVGVEHRSARFYGRASGYRYRLSNEIYFFAAPIFRNINLPPTEREGFEFDGTWRATPALDFSLNFRAVRAKFREGVIGGVDVAGNDIPLVPRFAANFGAAWRIADRTVATGAVRYVGPQRYDNDQANTFPREMPSYTVVDLKLRQVIGDLTLSAAVNNLFDEAYYTYAIRNAAGTSFNAYPMWRRSFFLAGEYRFR